MEASEAFIACDWNRRCSRSWRDGRSLYLKCKPCRIISASWLFLPLFPTKSRSSQPHCGLSASTVRVFRIWPLFHRRTGTLPKDCLLAMLGRRARHGGFSGNLVAWPTAIGTGSLRCLRLRSPRHPRPLSGMWNSSAQQMKPFQAESRYNFRRNSGLSRPRSKSFSLNRFDWGFVKLIDCGAVQFSANETHSPMAAQWACGSVSPKRLMIGQERLAMRRRGDPELSLQLKRHRQRCSVADGITLVGLGFVIGWGGVLDGLGVHDGLDIGVLWILHIGLGRREAEDGASP